MESQTVQTCTEQHDSNSASAAELILVIATESESTVTDHEETLQQDTKTQHQKPIGTGCAT